MAKYVSLVILQIIPEEVILIQKQNCQSANQTTCWIDEGFFVFTSLTQAWV